MEQIKNPAEYRGPMGELEHLIKQKKEIEAKIKELKSQSLSNGIAKIDVEHYPTTKPDRHFLAIYYTPIPYNGYVGRSKWQTIYSANSRQAVIDTIPVIINNLQKLYAAATEGERDG